MFSNPELIKQWLGESWFSQLHYFMQTPVMTKLAHFLDGQKAAGRNVQPKDEDIFKWLRLCPYETVTVVVVGMDPGERPPETLENFREAIAVNINDGLASVPQKSFEEMAVGGILFLDTTLTFDEERHNSHQNRGWEEFTEKVIRRLNQHPNKLVFLLLGDKAQSLAKCIDEGYHNVIEAPHPSEKEWYNACREHNKIKYFSDITTYLKKFYDYEFSW